MTECTTDFELMLKYRDQNVVLTDLLVKEQEARAKADARLRDLARDPVTNRVDSMGDLLPADVQLLSATQEIGCLRKALEFSLRLGLSFVNIKGTDIWYVHGGQPGPLHEMPAELYGVLEAARIAIRATVDGCVEVEVDGKPVRTVMPATPNSGGTERG